MGMDGVPVDEKGRWLYPFISWHCPRTQPQFDWWVKNIGAEKTFSHRRQHPLALLHRAAPAVDGRARAGNPEANLQVAVDRGFRQYDAVRARWPPTTPWPHARCSSTSAGWTGRTRSLALSGIDRRLLCASVPQRHAAGRSHGGRGRGHRAGGRHAGGAGRPRLPVRRAAGGRDQAGRDPGRERHLGDRAGLDPRAGADPRGAAHRRDRGGPRRPRSLCHLGRRGLVRHAGVVPQGVRLRGETRGRTAAAAWIGTF